MLKNSYFTPALVESERENLFSILSLNKLRFIYVESKGDVILKLQEFGTSDLNSLIHIASRSALNSFLKDYPFPIIEIPQSGRFLNEETKKNTLWETVFPNPFCNIQSVLRSDNENLIYPPAFKQELSALAQAIVSLEERLLKAEVGLVRFTAASQIEDFYLLLHSVRGSRIREGIPPEIDSFFSTFRGSNPTIKDFESYFGTSVAFAHVIVGMASDEKGLLSLLTESVLEATVNTITSVRDPIVSEESSEISL